jgi:PHD/YefM family antitoxin component YafN of YafNO toxin-antitoxin module
MLNLTTDIRSLSEFKRNTAACMEHMKASGSPLVLTVNGKAEIVVQDAAGYQQLIERIEMLEFLNKSLDDVRSGRTTPALEALNRLAKKHGLEPGER